ncbi:MAG: serine/threonine protein phosphatase, partial [Deltaproteobacteria bacterium CG_4_10_14_0_2_um_filter_43_8]
QQADCAQFLYGRVSFFSSKSPQKETPNEDALLVVNFNRTCTVLALADGVGGHKRGAEAARIALATLQEELLLTKEKLLRSVIVSAIEKANENILALGVGAATTLVIALLQDGHFQTFHAGDSACYVLGGRGKIKWKTTAHSTVGYAEEAGMLSEQEALAHEDRNVVLNVLGDKEMHIAVGPKKSLSRKYRVILASDGILDNLS